MYYRTSSIMLNTGQKSGNACDIFIAQPDAHKESLVGKLFILIEIESEKSEALKVINFLVNNINYNYYQNEKVILRERIESLKVEHIFETSLAKSNKDLVDFLSQEKVKISPYAFNITVAVIHEDNIHFSTVGKNKNLLIYQDKVDDKPTDANEEIEYRITEVSENKERKVRQISLTKLFTEVTSGRVPANGYFLLANEALSEYLSNKQLINIITKLPPAGAATQIKNTLEQINVFVSFLGIIIKNSTAPEKAPEMEETTEDTPSPESGFDPLTGLNSTEQKTEKILSPSGVINFSEWGGKIKQGLLSATGFISGKFTSGSKTTSRSKAKLLPLKDKVFFKKRDSQYSWSKLTLIAKRVGSVLFKLTSYAFKTLYQTLSDKQKMKNIGGNIKDLPRNVSIKGKKSIDRLRGLDKKHIAILLIIVIIFIAFFTSLIIANKQNNEEERQENIAQLTADIRKNQDEIEANLLYDNDKGAKELITENKELFDELLSEAEGPELQKEYQDIWDKHDEQIKRLKKATELEGANQIVNTQEIASDASPVNLILAGDSLFAGDASGETVYRVNAKGEDSYAITGAGSLMAELSYPALRDDLIYYLNNDNILQLDSGSDELESNNIEFPENKNDIVAMETYSNFIYLLNTTNNQIHKYTKSAGSFVGRTDWIEEEVDLSGAVDLGIDGSIYILFRDGGVEKYQLNRKQDFELDSIEPAFQEATRIQVSPEADEGYIYILEPVNNRIGVFNKEGDFQMQYQDSGFTDIRDFVVDEQNKMIYILNGSQIYSVEAEHLE